MKIALADSYIITITCPKIGVAQRQSYDVGYWTNAGIHDAFVRNEAHHSMRT